MSNVPAPCSKIGIGETTYYRWRQRHDPAVVDADRRCRELEAEAERLKRLVAELMLDKQMLQDIAKKSGDPRPAAGGGGLSRRALWRLAAAGLRRDGSVPLDREIPPSARARRAGLDREIKRPARRHPRYGYRRIHAMLVRRGWTVNLKRVRRLWIELAWIPTGPAPPNKIANKIANTWMNRC